MNLHVEFFIWNRGFNGGRGDTVSSGCVDNGMSKSKNMSVRANEEI